MPMYEGCRRPSALREIVARHGVTRPRVLGGAARGEDQEGSDLDLFDLNGDDTVEGQDLGILLGLWGKCR